MTENGPTLRDIIHAARAVGYRIRGARQVAKGRYDRALAIFDRAIEIHPDGYSGYAHRGNTYRLMGRYKKALADFDRAIELDPTEERYAATRTEIRQQAGRGDTDDALPSNRETKATCFPPAR